MMPVTLLHYTILHPLGSGGMGDVYLAEDSKLGRKVALKVLRDTHTDGEHRQRFEREARAVAALNHPNIVTIHAVEQDGDTTFITMELVEGKTLAETLPKGGLPVERLLKIAIPLADAVAAAHDRGITHRDLKPANVMLTADGRLKVLDFGLAKLRETTQVDAHTMTGVGPQPLTGEGKIVGTAAYMSPEQAEGKALDARTDLFSLGVMLFEMATGERPFKGETAMSVLSSVVKDTPPALTDVNTALPRHLARIVKRALVKDPDHRYQTAKDLRNDLETLKEELDSGTMEMSAVRSAVQAPAPRSRTPMALGIAALVVAIAGAAALWYPRGSAPAQPPAQPFDQIAFSRLTNTGTVTRAALSGDGRYVVHVVDDAGKQSLWLRQVATPSNVQIVPPEESRYDGLAFSLDGNFVYYTVYPQRQNYSTVFQVPALGGPPRRIIDDVDTPIAFSPDGKQFAFIRGYQTKGEAALFVAAADGAGERRVATLKFPLSFLLESVAWSPDGHTLVAAVVADTQRRVKLVAFDQVTGAATDIGDRLWSFTDSIAWMPDGSGLVVAAGEDRPGTPQQIWYVSFPQGQVRRITNDLNSYGQVTLSRDGRVLVATQREGQTTLWSAPLSDPARATQVTSGSGRQDTADAWTPDGRIVFTSNASGNRDVWMADANGANARPLTVDPADDTPPIVVTPDGRTILFQSQRAGGGIWRMDLDGANQRAIVPDPGAQVGAVSPDSAWLYYMVSEATPRQVWRVGLAGGTPERLTAPWPELGLSVEGAFYHPTFWVTSISPDGTRLAGNYSDPERRGFRLGLFPIAGGTPQRTDIIDPAVQWTPDGRSLLYKDLAGGRTQVFRWPLDGGKPTAITSFSDHVTSFALSRDGKQLALSRGMGTSDVVLITREQ